MALFTQIISDTFQRADEAPLNPVTWHSIGGVLPTVDELQIVSNTATTTVQVQDDGVASYINDSLPVDQYAELQITRLAFNGLFWLYLRGASELQPSYAFALGNLLISPTDPNVFGFLVEEISAASTTYRWTPDTGVGTTLNIGDVITFAVAGGVGGSLYLFKNRVQFAKYNLNDSVNNTPQPGVTTNVALPIIATTGRVGMQLDSFSPSIADIGVKNFAAGSFIADTTGTVISCAPRPEANTWEVIYTYPLDAGGLGQALVLVGPNQAVKQWSSSTSTITVPSSPGTSKQVLLAIPDIVKWATFGIGNFVIKTPFRADGLPYFLNAQ